MKNTSILYTLLGLIFFFAGSSIILAQENENNINKSTITVVRKPLMEDFTSSTCSPCADLNEELIPWVEENYDDLTLLKYPVNWPGAGDPYYTPEIGIRVDYYEVTGVPSVHINGTYAGWQFDNIIPVFEESLDDLSSFEIASSFTVTGTEIQINTHILSYSDIENLNVHTVVFENQTEGNTGTNGETEFHHVVMKMLPSADGEVSSFSELQSNNFSKISNLFFTFIEEFDDLGVVVFIQDNSTKEVYQSAYSQENVTYGNDATLASIMVDEVAIDGFSPNVFDYEVALAEYPIELPIITVETTDENAKTFVTQCEEIPGNATIKVFAEDLVNTNTYQVHFKIGTGTEDRLAMQNIYIYPNPANNLISVENWEQVSKMEIFSIDGRLVYSMNQPSKSHDLSQLERGSYLVKLYQADSHHYKMEKLMMTK